MDNFNWTAFTKKIAIKSPISEVYNACTIPQELEKWFLSKAIFTRPNGETVKPNEQIKTDDSYHWSWFLFAIVESGKVVETNGIDHLKFTFAGDCIVEIKLTKVAENIIVELTQSNIPTDNQSKRGIRLDCESGWAFYLVNLKSVLEGGIDLRNKDENLKAMVNN